MYRLEAVSHRHRKVVSDGRGLRVRVKLGRRGLRATENNGENNGGVAVLISELVHRCLILLHMVLLWNAIILANNPKKPNLFSRNAGSAVFGEQGYGLTGYLASSMGSWAVFWSRDQNSRTGRRCVPCPRRRDRAALDNICKRRIGTAGDGTKPTEAPPTTRFEI